MDRRVAWRSVLPDVDEPQCRKSVRIFVKPSGSFDDIRFRREINSSGRARRAVVERERGGRKKGPSTETAPESRASAGSRTARTGGKEVKGERLLCTA